MLKNMGVIRWNKFKQENKIYMLTLSHTYFDLYNNYYNDSCWKDRLGKN
jgi:hypothetical protein